MDTRNETMVENNNIDTANQNSVKDSVNCLAKCCESLEE